MYSKLLIHFIIAKCNKCNNTLSKNNKSGYCKVHYYKVNDGNHQSSTQLNCSGSNHSDIISNLQKSRNSNINEDFTSDKNLIAFIKDGMLKEKLWYEEMRKLFLDQINYLKSEILSKNSIIQQLISEISLRSDTNHESTVNSSMHKKNDVISADRLSSHSNSINSTSSEHSILYQWQCVDDININRRSQSLLSSVNKST